MVGVATTAHTKTQTTTHMKNTASLTDVTNLVAFARTAGLTVTHETASFSCGSFETFTINARRAGSGHRDEWVQVILSVRRLGRTSVSVATQTNWKPETTRGLWAARFNLSEIIKGLAADKARAKIAAEQREAAAALAETRRCLCCS